MESSEQGVSVGPSPQGLAVFSQRYFEIHELIGPIRGTVMHDPAYQSDYCMEIGDQLALEPEAPFRYVNHCCRPNCELVQITAPWNGKEPVEGELWLEVLSEIAPGDQITIDYAWPATSAIPCRCGCAECRGWIVAAEQVDQLATHSPRLFSLRRTRPEHRHYVRRLYRLWEKWNQRFFAGRLALPQILLSRSNDYKTYGGCGPSSHPGALSRIRLQLSLLTGAHPRLAAGSAPGFRRRRGYRWVAEVLLHEMVHQWRRETVGKDAPEWDDHGAAFCRKCNEIGRQLRLLPVRSGSDKPSQARLPSCAQWPHNARRPLWTGKPGTPANSQSADPS